MTIREYFENMVEEGTDWEEVNEIEQTIYQCWMDDALDFESWAIENGIDLKATETVLGMEVLVTELWGMDMCGD